MLFTSYTYLAFLVVAVLASRATDGRRREYVLLAASLIFYAAWDPRYVALLLALGLFTYRCGHALAQAPRSRLRLFAPLAVIVAVLALFKYAGVPGLVLPLGISFYTFECISYLLDVSRGAAELRPWHRFLLFPAFWPHLVAGPILRVKEFAPQLDGLQSASRAEILSGLDRILLGFVKKLVLANSLAGFVDRGFAGGARANSAPDNVMLAVAFGLQIYFDFSAYTDIAIGSARMVHVELPENFNLPFHASSPTDFWNRWHMTLSRWIRDYVFFPLNMKAGPRVWLRYVFLAAAMALVGLWHGAGWAFVAWGLWHGLLMVAHRILQGRARRLPPRVRRSLEPLGTALALALITLGWLLFRAPSLEQGLHMLATIATLDGLKPAYSVNDYLVVLACGAEYALLEPWLKRVVERVPDALAREGARFWLRPLAYAAAAELIFMFDQSNAAFIYFQF